MPVKRPWALLVALACAGALGCAPAQTHSTHLLRPGTSISGLDGVRVSAPAQWREGPETGVRVTITRLERAELAWPLDPGVRLGLPIYRVHAEVPVFTDSRERFTVSLPTVGTNETSLFPERLSTVIVDSDGPGGFFTLWNSDGSATFSAEYLTFEITGFFDDTHLFTAVLLDEPRPLP